MSGTGPVLWLVTPDLFLGSRIRGIAERAGYTVVTAPKLEQISQTLGEKRCGRLLVDLTAGGLEIDDMSYERLGGFDEAAAYAPHVRVDLLKAARAAGFHRVWTRSQLETELSVWLADRTDAAG